MTDVSRHDSGRGDSPPSTAPWTPEDRLAALHGLRRDPVVRRMARVAAESGAPPLHLVGGILRDAWLGRPTHDIDAVVAGGGRALAERLAEALPARLVPLGGDEFAALRLVGDGFEVDLWDRQTMSLEDDLARRDVTVNAIALDLGTEAPEGLADPFGGLEDLAARRLRAVTERSFREDPLRVVRLARLAAELPDFHVVPATSELARASASPVSQMAAERLRVELERLFAAEGAARGLWTLAQVDLYPALARPMTTHWPPPGDLAAARTAAREMEALPDAVTQLHRRAAAVGVDPSPAIRLDLARWASALQALPAPDPDDRIGPVDDPVAEALELLRHRGWASRPTLDPLRRLLAHPQPPLTEDDTDPGYAERQTARERWVLHQLGELWPTAVAWWGARAGARSGAVEVKMWAATADRLLAHLARDGAVILDPPKLLDGQQVARLTGVEPGPELGRILEGVRRGQVEGRVTGRGEAEAEALRLTGSTAEDVE